MGYRTIIMLLSNWLKKKLRGKRLTIYDKFLRFASSFVPRWRQWILAILCPLMDLIKILRAVKCLARHPGVGFFCMIEQKSLFGGHRFKQGAPFDRGFTVFTMDMDALRGEGVEHTLAVSRELA